jgi:hypothetical protein
MSTLSDMKKPLSQRNSAYKGLLLLSLKHLFEKRTGPFQIQQDCPRTAQELGGWCGGLALNFTFSSIFQYLEIFLGSLHSLIAYLSPAS